MTRYVVKIQGIDQEWYEEPINCNGTESAIVAANSCTIPTPILMASPFGLALTDSVYATVTSINAVGSSPESPAGNGAKVITWYVPSSPINV